MKHGYGGYKNHRCRCDVCVEANRAYLRNSWHRREKEGGARTVFELVCAECGQDFRERAGTTYCSRRCRDLSRTLRGPDLPPRQAPLSELVEAGEWDQVMARLLARTTRAGECMEWTGRRTKDGYPTTKVDTRHHQVHRLVLQAKHGGRPLGVLQSHHTCANPGCVNPDHLQPVTARDNVAEMRARQSYLARIRELEDVIREVAPGHPVLHRVPMNGVS